MSAFVGIKQTRYDMLITEFFKVLAGRRGRASCRLSISLKQLRRKVKKEDCPKCHAILFIYKVYKLQGILWKGFVLWFVEVFHACGSLSMFPLGIIVKAWIISWGGSTRSKSRSDSQWPLFPKKWKLNIYPVYVKDHCLNVPEQLGPHMWIIITHLSAA